jgi:hypothetical protein
LAAPTIKQHNSGFSTNNFTVSFSANTTAGNMLLVCVGAEEAGVLTVSTPTMTGETFVKITGMSNAGSTGNGQVACYAVNSAVGGQTVVNIAESNSGHDIHAHIFEITGQSGSPQDATGNTESTTLSVSTSGATTTANDLVIAFFMDWLNNRTFSAGSGYAQIEQTNNSSGGDSAFSESKTVSSTGVQTATASGNTGDTVEQGIIAIAGTAGAALTFEDDSYYTNLVYPIDPIISVW